MIKIYTMSEGTRLGLVKPEDGWDYGAENLDEVLLANESYEDNEGQAFVFLPESKTLMEVERS